jgi:hypothetical protein
MNAEEGESNVNFAGKTAIPPDNKMMISSLGSEVNPSHLADSVVPTAAKRTRRTIGHDYTTSRMPRRRLF